MASGRWYETRCCDPMSDITQIVAAARGRDKAKIGLITGDDTGMVYIVGTAAQFKSEPVNFDRILQSGTDLMNLPGKSIQTIGVVDDQIVIRITIPNLTPSDTLVQFDKILTKISQAIYIGSILTANLYRRIAFNHVVLEIQKIRLKRSLRAAQGLPFPRTAVNAVVREARIETRKSRIRRLGKTARSPARIVRKIAIKGALKLLWVVGLAVDVVLVSAAVIRGAKRAGPAGAVGGLVGGVTNIATIGFLPDQTAALGKAVERGILAGASAKIFQSNNHNLVFTT